MATAGRTRRWLRQRGAVGLLQGLVGAAVVSGVAPSGPASAQPASPGSLTPIERCLGRNLPERSLRQSVRFRRVDRLGEARVSQAEVSWRRFEDGSRARVRFRAPEDLRGATVLMLRAAPRAEVRVWLPELREVRRLEGSRVGDRVFGTDFSYEDLERVFLGHVRGAAHRRDDAILDGRDAFVVESRPDADDSGYGHVISYLDQTTCVPLRVDLHDPNGRLRKVMHVPPLRIERRGSRWLPTLVLMKDLVEETHTELIVDEVVVDANLPQTLFAEDSFHDGPRPANQGAQP